MKYLFLLFLLFINYSLGFRQPITRLSSLPPSLSRSTSLSGCSTSSCSSSICSSSSISSNTPLLVRAYRGEEVERIPVWLMRQAGRYMKEFRDYSTKYRFRERSENVDIATELSLQPWRRFGMDGVIMFSDILTPFPAMGIEFDIIEGKGPQITSPLRSANDIKEFQLEKLSFVGQTLRNLREKLPAETALIGFIGAPWTLLGYAMEGNHSKLCKKTKLFCLENKEEAHKILDKLTNYLCKYASYQIKNGAQILQVFESWAHHMSEDIFEEFGLPYANKISQYLKEKHPEVPTVYFANGGSCFFQQQSSSSFSALSFDWRYKMKTIRKFLGNDRVVAGNLDPIVLYSYKNKKENESGKEFGNKKENILREKIYEIINDSNNGKNLVFNLGHGVEKDISEEAVEELVNIVHNYPIKK